MPLYEYRCDACGHRFEQIQKFSDPPVEVCPNCGERSVQKLLSSPAIQFKGSGWYITDYARKGGGGDAASKSADSDKSEKSEKSEKKEKDSKSGPSETKSASDTAPAPSSSKPS